MRRHYKMKPKRGEDKECKTSIKQVYSAGSKQARSDLGGRGLAILAANEAGQAGGVTLKSQNVCVFFFAFFFSFPFSSMYGQAPGQALHATDEGVEGAWREKGEGAAGVISAR